MAVHWIFDFDGTLVDSQPAIKACFKEVVQHLAPERVAAVEDILIGPPLPEAARMILGPQHADLIPNFIEQFKLYYDQTGVFLTPSYPQAMETLQHLLERGDTLSIATNKRGHPTHTLLRHLKWDHFFTHIICSDDQAGSPLAKAQMITHIQAKSAKTDSWIFVGDTTGDGKAAELSQVPFVRAHYGYGQAEDWTDIAIHHHITEIAALMSLHA